MNKYLVALSVGGIMEQPEITYQDYQIIEANNKDEAEKRYNQINNCSFFYGSCMVEMVNGEINVLNKNVSYKAAEMLNDADKISTPTKPTPNINVVLAAGQLSDEILTEAFHILFGRNWKKYWSERDKAREMRSIIKGDTQPCCSFENWVAVIKYLLPHC